MAQIGRNERCPCGSGKKYKRCHGSVHRGGNVIAQTAMTRQWLEAKQVQRERQQGLGNPIVSAEIQGVRLVAVKNRLLRSKGWKTFHDFLFDYIEMAIGHEWGKAEIAKPLEERHPILVWNQKVCEYKRKFSTEPGKITNASMTGAVAVYMRLAYDLYELDHNAELQDTLLARLRNRENFSGARYEIHVAAIFIRAGFDIQFEDETDRRTRHCEFTATSKRTGKCFSVEAKRREGARFRIGRLFNDALSKDANHQRIIFIDLNIRDDATDYQYPAYFEEALARLRIFEGKLLNKLARPSSYVFITNAPGDLYLDEPVPRSTVIGDGFQIPDFKGNVKAPSLRHLIEAREKHIEMHDLMQSIDDHSEIPATFDGEIPEFAFGEITQRIIIGQRYMVRDTDGVERPAEVTTAIVDESRKRASCGVTFEDGRSALCTIPLSDEELAAWRRHPDTFFGIVGQKHTHANTPLELYDFFYSSFKQSSKDDLLKAMVGATDFDQLVKLDQSQLASIHAERTTYGALAISKK